MSLPEQVAETTQQVNDLFNSVELTNAMGTEDFRHFLDLFPIAVLVSKLVGGDQRIVYANKAAESLTGQELKDIIGRGWSILARILALIDVTERARRTRRVCSATARQRFAA
jgi:PAS domain-containing protein